MKKEVPNLIRVDFPYNPDILEDMMLLRFQRIIAEGYMFSIPDFNLFCAILLRQQGIEGAPPFVKKYALKDGVITDAIRFEMITLGWEQGEEIDVDFKEKYLAMRYERALKRKAIVRKEIGRIIRNAHTLTLKNSEYYRRLLEIVTQVNESLTLIDWFIPIVLTFERYVHFYVKHVEETKFGDGEFKNRSFFDYMHTEILTLLKAVLRQEEDEIKEHFIYVSVGREDKNKDDPFFKKYVKAYNRGFRNNPKLIFDNREFCLSIDINGVIQMFYQKK